MTDDLDQAIAAIAAERKRRVVTAVQLLRDQYPSMPRVELLRRVDQTTDIAVLDRQIAAMRETDRWRK